MSNHFKDETEITALVRAFETCEIHPAEFKHYQHLAVALCYVTEFPYDDAVGRMRSGIQKLAAAYGKTGYHETITLFWLAMTRDFVATASPESSLHVLANELAEKFADRNFILNYYSEALLGSAEAKRRWVEPDLKSL